ncbi:hypothetical protein QAD02_011620 [Eretmocerus hayati]|uniref:Uncharacterized protein n=1 Tax=Eretmocerus hayati TaxID=131215 RepID=A0ACC2NX23_9HYME|nr:hypothetical protein QAD02_011620 [Eretmocerus hayati]
MITCAFLLGFILTISFKTVICYDANKVEIYEEKLADLNETVIMSYRHGVFEEDKYARAICKNGNSEILFKLCTLKMQSPRFSTMDRNCSTTLVPSFGEREPILPRRLSTINNTIIFPWRDNNTDHDVLWVQLIDMTNCKIMNLPRIKVSKKSHFLIVPFSDSFDLIYEDISMRMQDHRRFLKQAFNQDGNQIEGLVSIFENIPESNFFPIHSSYKPLHQILAISTECRLCGYFFIATGRGISGTKILTLKPDGELGANAHKLDLFTLPDLQSYGQKAILFHTRLDDKTTQFVILDEYLNVDKREFNYRIKDGKELIDSYLVDFDEVLIVTCDDIKKRSKTKDLECYMEKIYPNDLNTIVPIPYILDEKNPLDTPHIISSYASERVCINELVHNNDGYSTYIKSICVKEEFL